MSLESNDMIIDADTTWNQGRTKTACAERKKENLIKGFRSVIHEAAGRPKASIFFIGSPGRGKEKDVISNSLVTSGITNKKKNELGFGKFLEACRWCEAKHAPDSDVYMYGYLGAFCSPECRLKAMANNIYSGKYLTISPLQAPSLIFDSGCSHGFPIHEPRYP